VCHNATSRATVWLVAVLFGTAVWGQNLPDWRKVGGSAVEMSLASPATGPVDRVWFNDSGSILYARTGSGRIFQSADFDTWSLVEAAPDPPPTVSGTVRRLPEPGARVLTTLSNTTRTYALGRQLYRSDDGGESWVNLTAYRSANVVGADQRSLAISPFDRDHIVVANDYGLWRSLDGGRSWSGLNRFLPNLTVRRILSTPAGVAGTRVLADGVGVLELPVGGSIWSPAAAVPDQEAALRERYSQVVRANISALRMAGDTVYIGSVDGRMWVSTDAGNQFRPSPLPAGITGPVESIFADAARPGVALAAVSGRGPHVLRTTNFGIYWDSLQGDLPDVPARAVTADRAAGALYAATDRGVFWAYADLENASTNPVTWTNLTSRLPAVPALDVRLDPAGVQLYASLEGYGVYAMAAPHRARSLRVVNAGDFSTRPAAPGSLLSVIGGRVSAVRGGGLNYPVLAASDAESQIQVPFTVVGPNVALAIETASGTVRQQLPVQAVSPAIMIGRDGAPMLWDAESGLPLDLRNVAHSGGRIQVWATGLGRVRPEWPAGVLAPLDNPPAVVAPIQASLDGAPLQVTRATLVPGFVGFYLIELQLPLIVNAGQSELFITADGQESNHVQVVIEP
jgi:uncharacterized protein (TIGR03437 family)